MAQVCERIFGEPKCPFHPDNNVLSFCEECSKLVCLHCMTSNNHKGHSFQNLDDMVKKSGNDVFQFVYNVNQSFLPKISQDIAALDKKKTDFKKRKASLLKAISVQYKKCVQQLKSQKQAMEEKVNTLCDRNVKHCDFLIEKLEALNKKMEGHIKEFQHIFDEGSPVKKIDAWKSIPLVEKETYTGHDDSELDLIEFVLDQNKVDELIKKALGEIIVYQNSDITIKESDVNVTCPPKHTQSVCATLLFNNASPQYCAITPIAEDKAWCTTFGENKIYLISNKRVSQNELTLKSASVINMFLHFFTGVLYGTFNDKTICTVDTITGATITVLTCLYVPGCLTVTSNGDIIVGQLPLSPGHVHRYSSKGNLLHQSKEKYNVCDISYCDISDHVAISCNTDGVRIMDGTLNNVIHTHKSVCLTAVYDKDGSLVIGDYVNKSIHILDGQIFSTIRTISHSQMTKPYKIRLYGNSMWIQCWNSNKMVHVMFE